MTPRLRTTTMAVGAVLLLSFPVGAVAANDGGTPSRMTIGGQPLTQFVHIELTAPFVAVDLGRVGIVEAPGTALQSTHDVGMLPGAPVSGDSVPGGGWAR